MKTVPIWLLVIAGTFAFISGFSASADRSPRRLFVAPEPGPLGAPSAPRCLGKPVTRIGTAIGEPIYGGPGPDVIRGRGGGDLIEGLGGRDRLCGGGGSDVISGGGKPDRINGGPADDTCNGEDERKCEG